MDIQFRAFYILRNIVRTNQEFAARVVESQLMDIVFAIQEIKDDQITNDKVCVALSLLDLIEEILESKNRF